MSVRKILRAGSAGLYHRALLFRYLANRFQHPGGAARRFMHSGLALEQRARQLSTHWTEHLSRSRAAQARWARTLTGESVLTVLGAGPLLDLNIAALIPHFRQFRFVDANPLLLSHWNRLHLPVLPVIIDITNCIEDWTRQVADGRGSWEETMRLLRSLADHPVPAYSESAEALLSLNILSQLDVGWQEALEPVLHRRFGRRFVQQHEQEWLSQIRPSSQVLIEQHLLGLSAATPRHILLISDLAYVEYTGRVYVSRRLEDPPVEFVEGAWRAEEGVQFQVSSALEGVSLDQATFARWLPSYQLKWHESWLWHIAPKGTEATDLGRLHRVGAFALCQRSSETVTKSPTDPFSW